MSVVMGATVAGLTITSQPASAITLNFEKEGDTPPPGWLNLDWTVEGRVGGTRTWEFTIKKDNEVSKPGDPQFDVTWLNGVDLAWSLDWDENTTTASFTIGNNTISLSPENSPSTFDGFYLWTRALTTANKVDPGTNAFLEVTTVNGESVIPVSSTATAPDVVGQQEITKNFFSSDTPITSMGGIARISWLDGAVNPFTANAQSRVGWKIEGFSTGDIHTPVPEPTSILGLLGFAAISAGSTLKHKHD